jgi:hypothetical protein
MNELTKTKEFEREAERRSYLAKRAGKLAAKSPKHISRVRKARAGRKGRS